MRKGLAERLLALLFPTRCIICREFLPSGRPRICERCQTQLPWTPEGFRRHGDFFAGCAAPLYYEGGLREAFLRYKFQNVRCYANAFGELLAECVYRELDGRFDLITWTPLDRRRLRTRGYDQTFLLAKNVSRRLCIRPVRLLKKKPGVKPQSGTGAPERRRANIAGAYTVTDAAAVAGRRILLIDDIITSGATLSECARTLLMAGADEIVCAALASKR